ncbi:MAG TPA: Wzz/FepE/Etk N-terminal domain-containing protein [Chryseolinea sp.]
MTEARKDEIDLLALLLQVVRAIRSNFWLIVLFFVLGTALGFGYYYSSRKVYENKMIVSSKIMTESYSKKLVDNLNQYIREGNKTALASQLGITEQTARELGYLKIESPYSNEGEVSKEIDRSYFVITVEVFSQDILPDLQKGLISYFENNEYVKIRVNQNREFLKTVIAKIDQEIKDLEGLKAKIYSGDFFQNSKNGVMFDPTVVNTKILDLTREKIKYQNDLELVNSVQLLEGFTRFDKPVKPLLSLSLVAGSSMGILLVIVFLVFKSIRKLLRMEEAARPAA